MVADDHCKRIIREQLVDEQARMAQINDVFGQWALAGLAQLRQNDFRFSESSGSHAALNNYRITGSSVLSFADDHCQIDAAAQVSSTQLYFAYQTYSKDSGLKAVSQKRFWNELQGEYRELEKYRETKTQRILYRGIDLLEGDLF